MQLKKNIFTIFCFAILTSSCFAQNGQVTINQDEKITTLLKVKKELNKNEAASDRYKIQIYNGHRTGAETAKKEFSESIADWRPTINFEPPNFKIWVGNFRTRLEADRALKKVKRKFPNAFIFKPKKDRS